jgi:hypothetical protein
MPIGDETEQLLVSELKALGVAQLGAELALCIQQEERLCLDLKAVQERRDAILRRLRTMPLRPPEPPAVASVPAPVDRREVNIDPDDELQVLRVPDYIVERRKKGDASLGGSTPRFLPGRAETATTMEQPRMIG